MRKYLGVLTGVVALGGMMWAQVPAQTPASAPAAGQTQAPAPAPDLVDIPSPSANPAPPPQSYPRLELFVGGTYAEAGLFNAGHWAGLPGWDSSLGVNASRWFGIVVEGGQYFGTSKIPRSVPTPFPSCLEGGANSFCPSGTGSTFNVTTREYNFLFGARFARRKYERWTPTGEILYGHQGTRGEASGNGASVTLVGTGRSFVAGGGADYTISPRLALRIKADYFETGSQFPHLAKQKQDNFRVSVGIVIRNVHKKKRRLEDEGQVEP